MGMGRREFLGLFASALAATTRAVALSDDLYVNRRLGLAFRKPAGWHFGDVKDMGEMAAGQVFNFGAEAQAFWRSLLTTADLPIVTVSKEPLGAKCDHFTPGITVFLDDFLDALDGPFTDQAKNDVFYCSQMLPEFRLLSPPQELEVSGCRAADYLIRFLFQHEQLAQPVPVNMRTINIYQRPTSYNIRLYDAPYLGKDYVHDYSDFIASLRLA